MTESYLPPLKFQPRLDALVRKCIRRKPTLGLTARQTNIKHTAMTVFGIPPPYFIPIASKRRIVSDFLLERTSVIMDRIFTRQMQPCVFTICSIIEDFEDPDAQVAELLQMIHPPTISFHKCMYSVIAYRIRIGDTGGAKFLRPQQEILRDIWIDAVDLQLAVDVLAYHDIGTGRKIVQRGAAVAETIQLT